MKQGLEAAVRKAARLLRLLELACSSEEPEGELQAAARYTEILISALNVDNAINNIIWAQTGGLIIGQQVCDNVIKQTGAFGVYMLDPIVIQMPILPRKISPKFQPGKLHEAILREALRCEWNTLEMQNSHPPKFKKVLLQYTHIYPDAGLVKDNDHYHTRNITDVITDFVSFGDGGDSCMIFQQTIVTKAVPSGSYVLISSLSDGILIEDACIQHIRNAINSK